MSRKLKETNLRQIRILYNLGRIGLFTDGHLLERFATGNGEAAELAFAALVERHGPMVLGVCRAILANEESARDAFQATFLVLLRKARSLWVQDSLGPWLYRVAHRAARNALTAAERRRLHERRAAELRTVSSRNNADCGRDELVRALHEEIARLPTRYQVVLVLCDLEGRTHEETARHLGCPIGTVKSRLARGRERLRARLTRRGMSPATALILNPFTKTAEVAIPDALVRSTVEFIKQVAASKATLSAKPVTAVILAKEVLSTMSRTKFAIGTAILVGFGSLILGGRATQSPVLGERANWGLPADDPPGLAVADVRTLEIHVVDADGKPMQGVHLFQNHVYKRDSTARDQIENKNYRTDAEGKALIELSGSSVDLRLWAKQTGFVPLHAMWAKRFQADGDQIPAEFTFQLKRGTEIGGIVVNEEGKPIKGVKIEVRDRTAFDFHAHNPNMPGQRPVRSYALAEGTEAVLTDEHGRWNLGNVPSDEDLRFAPTAAIASPSETTAPPLAIELHLDHPDYVSNELQWGDLQRQQNVTLKSLRNQTAKIVLFKK